MTFCRPRIARFPLRPALVALALAAAATTSCESRMDMRGNMPDPDALAEIKPGVTTQAEVSRLLGAPSTVATFDKKTWYYIGGQVKSVAFFRPEILKREVVTVRFDDRGRVAEVKTHDATEDKDVQLVDRVTPTKGKELTILQQILGNVGRFGSPDEDRRR